MSDQCSDNAEIVEELDHPHAQISAHYRRLFQVIQRADRAELWRDSGARDLAHWLAIRYGISEWKARRWIAAAHALEGLPWIASAFASGELGVDKVVELTRFASGDTEADLIGWAHRVSGAAIRRRADLAARQEIDQVRDVLRSRSVSWWYFDEGRRFGLEADLPAASGAVVAKALERLAGGLPVMPEEEGLYGVQARRADALVALCSAGLAAEPDADRATVVVHASIEALESGEGGCEIEGGPVIHAETARRLMCDGRAQTVVEDAAGRVLSMGRMAREPSAAMMRQLGFRDFECAFPGCGSRRFLRAHHIVWWSRGGSTDLDNLALICSFHHTLVHEFGWSMRRRDDGVVRWFEPNGARYQCGPAPPSGLDEEQSILVPARV